MAVIRLEDGSIFVGECEEAVEQSPAQSDSPAAEKPKRTRKVKD